MCIDIEYIYVLMVRLNCEWCEQVQNIWYRIYQRAQTVASISFSSIHFHFISARITRAKEKCHLIDNDEFHVYDMDGEDGVDGCRGRW